MARGFVVRARSVWTRLRGIRNIRKYALWAAMALIAAILLLRVATCSGDAPPPQQQAPVTTEPSSMDEVFRGQASVMVVYQGKQAEYSVGPNRQADFSPENRALLNTSEEKRGFNKVRVYSFKNGLTAPDSTLVAVCEYPATIKTAICTW